jgi:hypothetical protein
MDFVQGFNQMISSNNSAVWLFRINSAESPHHVDCMLIRGVRRRACSSRNRLKAKLHIYTPFPCASPLPLGCMAFCKYLRCLLIGFEGAFTRSHVSIPTFLLNKLDALSLQWYTLRNSRHAQCPLGFLDISAHPVQHRYFCTACAAQVRTVLVPCESIQS